MARTRGAPQAKNGRQRRQENLASLSAEVLRLRLQSLNLPITGSKADLVHRLKAATQRPRADNPPPAGRVDKRMARKRAVRPVRTRTLTQVVNNDALLADNNDARDNVNDDASSAVSEDDLDEPLDETSVDLNLSAPQAQPAPFMAEQLATIQDTVRLSLDQALQSRPFQSIPASVQPYYSLTSPPTQSNQHQRPGAATPLGLQRPLDKNLEDKILRGEYIDFTLLLPDSLTQPQAPEIQLCLDDSAPGSSSPLTMVRKRKPIIDTFHKWLDAYTTYMLVLVAAYPRRSLELLKYQQTISCAATKFKGLSWLTYDEQFRRRAAYDLTINWGQVDLELWTVTFSGLAKQHCLLCSSPYHSQSDCPSEDTARQQPKNSPVCFRFNRSSGCTSSSCPFPHVCRRCRSSSHSILSCPRGTSRRGQVRQWHQSTSAGDRGKR